jgi:hypothetical protein
MTVGESASLLRKEIVENTMLYYCPHGAGNNRRISDAVELLQLDLLKNYILHRGCAVVDADIRQTDDAGWHTAKKQTVPCNSLIGYLFRSIPVT